MSLLDTASLLLTPNAYKEGKLYSVIPSDGSGDFTFTRATSATRVNSEGLIEVVSLLGNELVTNGDFANGTTGWSNGNSGVNTIVNGYLVVTGTGGSYASAKQVFPVVAGRKYIVSGQIARVSGIYEVGIEVNDGAGSGWNIIGTKTTSSDFVNVSEIITVNSGATQLDLRATIFNVTVDNTNSLKLDNVSVKEVITNNIPRLDYSLGGCPNILLEPQRTNLLPQSSSFDNVAWSKSASTVTANETTSPSGILDADNLTANGLLNLHSVLSNFISVTNTPTTLSVYAKKNTNNFIQLAVTNGAGGMFANFDIENGVVGSVGTTTGSNPTSTIQSVGNGWYRCAMTFTPTTSATAAFYYAIAASATDTRLLANTLSTSVYLWGAQLEAGSYATSYIPTTTASVTRNVDSITRNNIYTNGLITAAGGTWFVEIRGNVALTRDANVPNFLFISNNSSGSGLGANVLAIGNVGFTNSRMYIFKLINGAYTQLAATTTTTIKIAIKWNGSTADVFVNGVKVVTNTAFTTTNMEFLNCFAADVPKYINQMALFPTPLTDAQCLALTA